MHGTNRKTNFGALLMASFLAGSFALPVSAQQGSRGLSLDLGTGPKYSPAFEGSSKYKVTPGFVFGLNSLSFGKVNIDRNGNSTGFSFGPSFRYVGKRELADAAYLAGIPDVDYSIEVGGKIAYEWDRSRIFAKARKGFNGHTGVVGEVGADWIMRPSDNTTIEFGPRISFADDGYMGTYFSVPATATVLAPFTAKGGIKSAGIDFKARRSLNDTWAIELSGGWNKLLGDAAKSPIVKAGAENQYTIGLSLVRTFNLRF